MFREFGIIVLLTTIGSAFSLYHEWAPIPWLEPTLMAGEITLADARTLDPIWIDARSIREHENNRIPDSIHFDESDWSTGLFALMETWLERPRPIVIYCGSETCGTSKRIAKRLRESMTDAEIYSLKGAWTAWQK